MKTSMKYSFLLSWCCLGVAPVYGQTLDQTISLFWNSQGEQLEDATRHVVNSRATFDEIYHALRGVRFGGSVATGRRELVRNNTDGTPHPYVIIVPSDYDPATSYPVRFYLHGGVRRPAWDSGGLWWRRYDELARDDEMAVFPASWDQSAWWQASQVENLAGILRDLKATYNIDDNRVYMFGVSDGGSGVYFHAFRAPTPWAAFVPMIGHPAVLSNPRVGTDGELYPVNLWNSPFYVLNGDTDRLYPVRSMIPWIRFFEGRGVDITFRPVNSGHTVDWWPDEAAGIEEFISAKVRNPHPQRLVWETERTDRYNRLYWLVIDDLGPPGSQPDEVANDPFPHRNPSGRMEVERHGNNVIVESQGVARFTVLVSPDVFDLDEPIGVIVNGTELFRQDVPTDLDVLLKWAAADRDRTMLYATQVQVTVPVN